MDAWLVLQEQAIAYPVVLLDLQYHGSCSGTWLTPQDCSQGQGKISGPDDLWAESSPQAVYLTHLHSPIGLALQLTPASHGFFHSYNFGTYAISSCSPLRG